MTEDISGLLAQYLDEELDASETEAVESAIARDDSTATALADLRRIRNSLTELKPVEPSAGFAHSVMAAIEDEPARVIPFSARPRFIIPAAAAAILLVALLMQPFLRGGVDHPADSPVQVLSLVNVEGGLHTNRNVAHTGDIFYSGDTLKSAADGFARLDTGGGRALIGPNTSLTLMRVDDAGAIQFEDGLLLASGPAPVRAAGATISGEDAEFGVVGLADRSPRLIVERGSVQVAWDGGRIVSVPAGMEYALIDGGEDVPITSASEDGGERLARMLALKTYAACGSLGDRGSPVERVLFDLKPSSASHRTGRTGGGDNASVSYGADGLGGGLGYHGSGMVDFTTGVTRLAVKGPGQQLRMLGGAGSLYVEGAGGIAPVQFGIEEGVTPFLPVLDPGGSGAPSVSLSAAASDGWAALMGGVSAQLGELLKDPAARFELKRFSVDDGEAAFSASSDQSAGLEFKFSRADCLPREIRSFAGSRHLSTLSLDYAPSDQLPALLDFSPLDSAIPAEIGAGEFQALLLQTFGELPIRIDPGNATDTHKE